MALQQSVSVLTVTILLLCTGCRSALTCGQTPNTRIFGGFPSDPGEVTWHASLVSGGKHRCGGSLINDQWVMTAAHCVTGSGSGITVYLGRFNQSGPNPHEVSRTIAQAKCHPSYSPRTYENDICLLKLSSPVNFTNYTQPVCLADANSTIHRGGFGFVAGFGNTSHLGPQPSNSLQEADLDIVGNKECQCNTTLRITDKMICTRAAYGRVEPCQGDSGGSLVIYVGSGWTAVGIVSFGDGCAKPNVFGVYTRVSEYMEWISIITGSDELGFVNVPSSGDDKDANFNCSTPVPPTSTHPYTDPYTHPHTNPPTTIHSTTDDKSIFGGGENLIHFTSLWVLALSLYVLVGHA